MAVWSPQRKWQVSLINCGSVHKQVPIVQVGYTKCWWPRQLVVSPEPNLHCLPGQGGEGFHTHIWKCSPGTGRDIYKEGKYNETFPWRGCVFPVQMWSECCYENACRRCATSGEKIICKCYETATKQVILLFFFIQRILVITTKKMWLKIIRKKYFCYFFYHLNPV